MTFSQDNDTTRVIASTAIDLFHRWGPWHPKEVYRRALRETLSRQNLRVLAEPRVALRDEWDKVHAVYRPDLVVKDDRKAVIVGISLDGDDPQDATRQIRAWLSAWRGPAVGLLLHFGRQRLTWTIVSRFGNKRRGDRAHDSRARF